MKIIWHDMQNNERSEMLPFGSIIYVHQVRERDDEIVIGFHYHVREG
jgi:hypothetical protein